MEVRILAAESLGVRGLCCLVTGGRRRVLIDPGLALGYWRHGLRPHPRQIVAGRRARRSILAALPEATDLVFSHFHGDHVPLADANPYQLALEDVPPLSGDLRAWCPSPEGRPETMRARHAHLAERLDGRLRSADGETHGPFDFSAPMHHGAPGSPGGTVMMTRVRLDGEVFVHASDIQLLDGAAVDAVLAWSPDLVLAAGPPLYLDRLDQQSREEAWTQGLRLARGVGRLVLDHHLLRSEAGARWLHELAEASGGRVCCAADHEGRPRRLLEARREELYRRFPVSEGWHERVMGDSGRPHH